MPFQPPAHYAEGAVITVSSRLTAHHKGHFEMYACADLSPSQGCFNKHPLAFVEDMLYGAPPDPSYPGRAYVAPNNGQAANGRLCSAARRLWDGRYGFGCCSGCCPGCRKCKIPRETPAPRRRAPLKP